MRANIFTIQAKEFIMTNELVTMPNGTEVVSMAVTVTNMSATTNQNDYAETLNVAAEYITAIKWQEGGTKNLNTYRKTV